jgi:hypothetical protein
MGLTVKRDSSGYGNLPPMCPTFQPGPRFEWRYTVPERATAPQLYHAAPSHCDMFWGKIAQVAA